MCRNGYLCTSGVNLDTAVWFADPDFLLECKISAIIPTKFEVDMTIHCRVIAFLSGDTSRDFVTDFWPFVLEELLCMAGHVTNLATKLEDRMPIRSWFMSHNVGYHWECVRGHCACAESRDPWVGVKNNYIFGIPDPDLPIHYASSVALRWM